MIKKQELEIRGLKDQLHKMVNTGMSRDSLSLSHLSSLLALKKWSTVFYQKNWPERALPAARSYSYQRIFVMDYNE